MFKRQDGAFSETNLSTGGLTSIHLTKDKFLYAFTLLYKKLNNLLLIILYIFLSYFCCNNNYYY